MSSQGPHRCLRRRRKERLFIEEFWKMIAAIKYWQQAQTRRRLCNKACCCSHWNSVWFELTKKQGFILIACLNYPQVRFEIKEFELMYSLHPIFFHIPSQMSPSTPLQGHVKGWIGNKDTLGRCSHHVPVVGVEGLVDEREGVCAQFLLVANQLGELQEGKAQR